MLDQHGEHRGDDAAEEYRRAGVAGGGWLDVSLGSKMDELIPRREFLKKVQAMGLGLAAGPLLSGIARAGETGARPNVLLVIFEDWGPYLGCYGHTDMFTPNVDKLAEEGQRFTNCFSMAPVCSPGRSTLMTGMSQYTTHSEQHRTAKADKRPLPAGAKSLPQIFRDAGYFTALGCGYSQKVDLNFQFESAEIYQGSDWKERKPGQPFFAHTTFLDTHRKWKHDHDHPIDPAKVTLPAWYPDTPLTRADWAMGLESAQIDDRCLGELITRLKNEGLYDNTIIVVTADHGIALPRGKQFLYSQGLHIPLVIRWPASVKPSTVDDRLVSNIDIEPTILALAGLPIPPTVQGKDVLNPANPARRYIFAGRDKMDETHDAMRAVRSHDFEYILNLMPERAYCQFNNYKESCYPGLATLNVLHMENKLSPVQDAFMKPSKPEEELYDLRKDPDEVHNLANDPAYADVLNELRAELKQWRDSVGDPGVTEVFRNSGWSSKYPTRSLQAWEQIESQWETYVLHDGPYPHIKAPSGFEVSKKA
jgi:arylsulfatase A-like enzyme